MSGLRGRPKQEAQSDARKKAWLESFAESGIVAVACSATKVDRATIMYWRKHDADFRVAYHQASNSACDALEAVARKKALGGNVLLLMFLLKAANPKKFAGRYIEQDSTISLNNRDVRQMTDAELEKIARESGEK